MNNATRYAGQAILLCVALSIFWIACVASFRPHELYVGIPSVALSVAFCLFTVRSLPLQFRPSFSDLIQAWRLPWYVVVDVVQIVLVLACDFAGRPAPSHFISVPWGPTMNNGTDTAKRSLAVACTTISPNVIVIGVDCGQGQMLLHQLRASPVPLMTRRLGAGGGR